jgi:hypothetical protein
MKANKIFLLYLAICILNIGCKKADINLQGKIIINGKLLISKIIPGLDSCTLILYKRIKREQPLGGFQTIKEELSKIEVYKNACKLDSSFMLTHDLKSISKDGLALAFIPRFYNNSQDSFILRTNSILIDSSDYVLILNSENVKTIIHN